MEVRVSCPCDQTYAFDVEPVNGAMPVRVNCPACGADGTAQANEVIRQTLGIAPPAPPPVAAPASPPPIRINRPSAAAAPPPPPVAQARFAATPVTRSKSSEPSNNLALGALGALVGAGLGAALMFGLSEAIGFKFPMFGTVIGLFSGLGARILYRGTDSTLGGISAVISLVAVTGTLYLMFGDFLVFNIISILVSAMIAWRIAS